ncbi:MAG: hypothetical protein AAGF01_05415 [Cyanobacteria bacterium P01_G01_bin.38]
MISYETWLNRIFGRSVNSLWDPSIEADAPTIVRFIARTFYDCKSDLQQFSDKQVGHGLHLLLIEGALLANLKAVPFEDSAIAIRGIKVLYRDCFALRTRPVLSHLDEPGGNALNGVCYLLWEDCPLRVWGKDFFELSMEVLECALSVPHVACVESALHGLGHLGGGSNQRVQDLIEDWLPQQANLRSELRRYAEQAKHGRVL